MLMLSFFCAMLFKNFTLQSYFVQCECANNLDKMPKKVEICRKMFDKCHFRFRLR